MEILGLFPASLRGEHICASTAGGAAYNVGIWLRSQPTSTLCIPGKPTEDSQPVFTLLDVLVIGYIYI